jgi:hypothetical protein
MFKGKQNWYEQPILHNICIKKHPPLVISSVHVITSQRNILGSYNNNCGSIKHNLVHVLNHGSTHKIYLVQVGIIF